MWTLGQLINSRYRILTVGAEGEGETLCRATDERSGKECLLDFIPCKPGGESDGRLVSQSDIEKLRELNHPLIVVPESIEETAEGFVVINDSFDGLTLEELLQAEGPLPLHRACFIVRQAAIALEASHHSGLIHGDLKPSDILLIREDGQERVKVRGFGIFGLKQHTFVNVARLALNSEGPILGHPGYISPEQALGTHADALDGRSDVYSLGVIFYRALSGRLPFERGSSMELLLAHIFSPPPSLAQSCEIEIPEVVDSLVLRCLAKRREDRPASATALIDQLGPWEAREPAAAQTAQVQEGQAESALAEAEAPSSAEPAFRLANAPVFPVESVESQTPPVFVADFGSTAHAGAVDFSAAVPPPAPANRPTLEAAPMLSAGSVETKTQFVADLETPQRTELQIKNASLTAPPGPVSAAAAAPSPLDIPLDTARAPAAGQKAPPRQQAVEGEPTLFSKTYGHPRKTRPPSGSGAKWIWAAVILLLLIGGACGWLTYTGRTYWFRPQFVKQRISSLISSASGNGELHLQEVNQDPDSASPAPASGAPQNQGLAAPSAPSSPGVTPPVESTGSATGATAPPVRSAILPSHPEEPPAQAATAATHSAPPLQPIPATLPSAAPATSPTAHPGASVRLSAETAARAVSFSAVQDAIEQGESYFERGDYDDALHAYQKGLAQDPLNTRLRDDIARAKKAKAAEAKYLGQ